MLGSAQYQCGTVSSYTTATMSSKAKKLMTKTNRSQAGIINMVSNISNVVGYSNVVPFLEHDTGNMTSGTNSIIKRNKDTCSRKQCNIIDGNIPSDANVAFVFHHDDGDDEDNNKNNNNKKKNDDENNDNDDDDNKDGDVYDKTDAYVDAESDSLASMETLSDNVAIWVDGERHWISGVDANTTCMDLICALLNYQTGQQMFNHNTDDHGQDNLNAYHDVRRNTCNNENSNNNCNIGGGNNTINQSMPTKEGKQECVRAAVYQDVNCHGNQNSSNTKNNSRTTKAATTLLLEQRNVTLASEYVIVKQHRHCEEYLDGKAKVFDVLPTKAEEIFSNGVGIGIGGGGGGKGNVETTSNRKECELYLRRLVSNSSTAMGIESHVGTSSPQQCAGNTQVASLLSTDKDSGMGSPVGSSRSVRFRRRKYKSASWFSQGNTLHPKVALQRGSGFSAVAANAGNNIDNVANERLMRIILAQDETIHRQLSLLKEKEKQISKIEEEKHRVRERELGKNYLLETYFKGLDEAACEPNDDGDEEIFIDEPYQPIHENVEATTMTETSQHRSLRHNKKLSNFQHKFRCQQRSNQLGNNTSSDVVKAKNFVSSEADDTAIAIANASESVSVSGSGADVFVDNNVDNQKEIELQIFWLEKVYALNKQVQREEETLLKLHAKIRKHQVRCAYQMKNDVLEQIDELDAKLALQCADICRVEDNLEISDEKLKGKLNLLEKLNAELHDIQELTATSSSSTSISTITTTTLTTSTATTDINNENSIKNYNLQSKSINTDVDGDGHDVNADGVDVDEISELELKSKNHKPIIEMSNFVEPINTEGLKTKHQSNSKQTSFGDVDERIELQNVNIKTHSKVNNVADGIDAANAADAVNTTAVVSPMTKLPLSTSATYSSMLNQQQQKQNLNELLQQRQEQQQQQQVHNYPIGRFNQFEQSSAIATDMITNVNTTIITHALTDKNMLPQHVPNVKIIKKPMYEALSLNQMPSSASVAVTCQQILPSSIPTALLSSPIIVPLNDENGIDLSHLGTLV